VTIYFLDSSALVKRYVTEDGSDWIRELSAPSAHNPIIIARIAWIEVLSALARRQREGNLAQEDCGKAIQAFRHDVHTQYQIAELDQMLAETAGQLVGRYPLRAYDAVQLASALHAQADLQSMQGPSLVFLTADVRLFAVAEAEGLQTNDPSRPESTTTKR